MKKYFALALGLVFVLGLMQSVSFAEGQNKFGGGGAHGKSVKEKFFKKVKMIYSYQEEIGVSDEQLAKIKDIKIALKKDLIRKDADIDIIKIDIMSLLYEDQVDLEAVNKLVDQKYDIKKEKAKKTIATYAELKKILTEEQLDKLKGFFMKGRMHGEKGAQMGYRMMRQK